MSFVSGRKRLKWFLFAGFAKVTPDMKIVGVSLLYLFCWELRVFDAGSRRGRVLEYVAQANTGDLYFARFSDQS